MTATEAPGTRATRTFALSTAVQPKRLSTWLCLYGVALLLPFAFQVGKSGGAAGMLAGPWLLLRAMAGILVYRFVARPTAAAALAAGLGAGHLVAVVAIDPPIASMPLGRLVAVAPALFAFLAANEHLWLMANRNAVVAKPAFLVRAAVAAFAIVCFSIGPLLVSVLFLAIVWIGGPLPNLRP